MKRDISRRSFLKNASIASAAVIAAPAIINSCKSSEPGVRKKRVFGPNDRVNIAFIGIGSRGHDDALEFEKTGMCNVVALCDVDMGSEGTQEIMAKYPDAPRFRDWRVMFDEMAPKIDAVLIATPDHSHFVIAMAAIKLGIAVYLEKPMAHTFAQCERLMEAAKKYGVVTQMGNQGHSEANYFQFKAWQDAGIIKDVTAVTAHMNNSRRWHTWDPKITSYPAAEPIPDTLDWDGWACDLYPTAYNALFHYGQWRCWYQYGMGALGDWGAHIIDTVHEFLDLGLPEVIDPVYLKDRNPFFFPMASTILFKFPERGSMPALDLTWYDGADNLPKLPEGYGESEVDPNIPPSKNEMFKPAKLNPGKEIYTKTLTFKGASHGTTLSIIPVEVAKEMEGKLPEVPESPSNHYENFLLAVMGHEKTRSPFELTAPLSQVFCLGVIAQWTGRKLIFDRNTKQITNDPEANSLLCGPAPRPGWEEFYKI